MNTKIEFIRINNDVNGNPRYVCHYVNFINSEDEAEAKRMSKEYRPFKFFIEYEYNIALQKAKKIGGKKFHNKQYGGGIVFQSYNIQDLEKRILEIQKD